MLEPPAAPDDALLAGAPALSPEELLAGAAVEFEVVVPPEVLHPAAPTGAGPPRPVRLRPLTIGAFQLILKAARGEPGLVPLLMIRESLVAPRVGLEQVKQMHLGLVDFLVAHIREISGLGSKKKSPPS